MSAIKDFGMTRIPGGISASPSTGNDARTVLPALMLEALRFPLALYSDAGRRVCANAAFTGAVTEDEAKAFLTMHRRLLQRWTRDCAHSGSTQTAMMFLFGQRVTLMSFTAGAPPGYVLMQVERRAARRLSRLNLRQRFGLSPRQAEVGIMLAEGHGTREMARRLGTSPHTVRHHVEQVLLRLNVRSRRLAVLRLQDGSARGSLMSADNEAIG